MIETENYGMSLIRNRRGFLGALFSALLALALFDHGAATAQEAKQIKLTEKHIQGFMAAYEDIAKLYYDANPDTPEDPKVEGAGRGCRQEEQKSVLLAKQRTRGDFSCSCGCRRTKIVAPHWHFEAPAALSGLFLTWA
jgi:hypothetical protein